MQIGIIVLGELGVGKTSLLRKLKTNTFEENTPASVSFDYFSTKFETNGQDAIVQYWDTAGQERFGNITKQYFNKAHGAAVIVSAQSTNEDKIRQFEKYLQQYKQHKSQQPCILIVAKSDLMKPEDKPSTDYYRDQLKRLKDKYECEKPKYLSAKTSSQKEIDSAFRQLVNIVLKKKYHVDPTKLISAITPTIKLKSQVPASSQSECCK